MGMNATNVLYLYPIAAFYAVASRSLILMAFAYLHYLCLCFQLVHSNLYYEFIVVQMQGN
jgi:hypothetical protein